MTSKRLTQYITTNPTNGKKLSKYSLNTWSQVSTACAESVKSQKNWSQLSSVKRSEHLPRLAKTLRGRAQQAAELMALEMGKPIKQGLSEIEKCAFTCEYYANNFERLSQAKIDLGTTEKNLVVLRPLGVVLGIMPWNFPFWQVLRFAIPTLTIGNTILIKHALNTSGCAEMLQDIFIEAGFPKGVYQNVLMDHSTVEKLLLKNDIAGVSLTGSTRAGIQIAGIAAKTLKKCVFELGGSDAYIVLKDADLEKAIEVCARARLLNSGQSCVAAKRFIVEKPLLKKFTEGMIEKFDEQVIGDPLNPSVTVGPLARKDLRDGLNKQVLKTKKQGARIVFQSEVPKSEGSFYPCTIMDRVEAGMTGFDEELFGPVASIIEARDEKEAIELANKSSYGLGGAIFSRDLEKAERLAIRHVEAGNVFVNENVKSMPPYPFGGIKLSGYGRELGEFGIHEFANIKTVQIATP